MGKKRITLILVLVLTLVMMVNGADWPGFRGANRDAKSTETGLLKQWPEGGPKLIWSVEGLCGTGFSSVAIAEAMVYTAGMLENQEYVLAFDIDGYFKWKTSYGPAWTKSYPGTRTIPTIDGDRLYVMSGNGIIACLNAKTGKINWKIDTAQVYQAKNIKWGISESVMIYKNKVICTPGGADATMVALDKMTGELVWRTKGLSETSAYCSAILAEHNGRKIVITNVQESVLVVDPDTGEALCHIPHKKRHNLSAVSPVYYNGLIYVTSGYTRDDMPDRGAAYELSADAKSFTQKWTERKLDCHHGGVVLLSNSVHGTSSAIYPPASKEDPKGNWYCVNLDAGKVSYEAKLVGKGSAMYADGLLYCYGETGELALVKPGNDGYEKISSFMITRGHGEHWAHPAISDGRLYIRHGDALMVYDIKAQ